MLVPHDYGKNISTEQLGKYGDEGEARVYAPHSTELNEMDLIFVPKEKRDEERAKYAERLRQNGPRLAVTLRTQRYTGGPPFEFGASVRHLRMLHAALGKALEQFPEYPQPEPKTGVAAVLETFKWHGSHFPIDDCFAALKSQVAEDQHEELMRAIKARAVEYNSLLE